MALTTVSVKDSAGTSKNMTVSDSIGGGTLANAMYLVNGTTEVGSGNPLPIVPTAGEAHVGEVGGKQITVQATFTRPADTTAYTAGDALGNSTSALAALTLTNAMRVNGGTGYLTGLRISTNKKSITPRIRVRVFNSSSLTLSNDNAAYQSKYTDESKRVARFDLPPMSTPTDTTNSDMSEAFDYNLRVPVAAAGGGKDLYLTFEAVDGFTPDSGQGFTVTATFDTN